MTRAARAPSASLSLEELLAPSAWFVALGGPARRPGRADLSERAIAQGASLGRYGERQLARFGVLEGLIKSSVTRDASTVTLGGSPSAAGSAKAR